MSPKTSTKIDVEHIASLAHIPITPEEEKKMAQGFETTLEVIEKLNMLDTANVEPTHQVTGLVNVFREDVVDKKRMLTNDGIFRNAKRVYNGYFVVNQILDER